jgi:ubiquinone/menaquinone biosynthesis C-methylase UbiE
MKQFLALIAPKPEDRLLDIGGAKYTWSVDAGGEGRFHVTLANLVFGGESEDKRFTNLVADATALPLADNSFDIAYSNSVIEHVGSFAKQMAFANEARRVARKLWIQTPARSFPVEPHLVAPFIQFLPKALQHLLVPFTLRGIMSSAEAHSCVDEVRLLTYREFRQMFPDCRILRERVLGLTKSYIAIRT